MPGDRFMPRIFPWSATEKTRAHQTGSAQFSQEIITSLPSWLER